MGEFFLQILKTHKISIIFWKHFFSIHHKVHFHSFFWVVLVFSGVEAFLGFDGVFLSTLKSPHFFAYIERFLIGSADIREHSGLVIRSTEGGFVENEAFVLAKDSFAVAVDFGWIFEETFFGLLFGG